MSLRPKTAALLVTAAVVLVLGASIGAGVFSGNGKGHPVDPDEGLDESQVIDRQATARASFEDRLTAWFAALDVAKLDLRSLPHAEILATVEPAPATFVGAVKEARVVVTGTVTSIAPQLAGTIVTLSVDETLKGVADTSLQFTQGSTLEPTPDWSGTIIADSPGTALLLPGTRGEFLLDDDGNGGLALQEVAGAYLFGAGVVETQPMNPFAELKGISTDRLIETTRAALN